MLREHLQGKTPHARVFTMPEKTAKMLRIDLEAVGIPYTTELGRVVDFHFLRNTC